MSAIKVAPQTEAAGIRTGLQRLWQNERFHYYLMFIPALFLLIGVLYPFSLGVYTSLTNEKLYLPTSDFVGFDNYKYWFSDRIFRESAKNTAFYVLAVLAIQIPLGILVALILDISTPLRTVFRSVLVLPLLIPPIVAGLMWKTMMHPTSGVLNWLGSALHLGTFSWLSDPDTALISMVVIDTWVYMPFSALILLAGLQSIPVELTEAIKVDGGSDWAVFRHLQLPWLMPYVLLVMLFRSADAIKTFEIIYPTTRGGPLNATRVFHILAYEEAFRWSNIGRAMAIVFILWLLSYVVSTVLFRIWQRRSEAIQGGA